MALSLIWAIRKAFQCILQGVRFLLANHTRLSPTSENDSYILCAICISAKTQTYQYISAPPILCTLPLTMIYNSKNAIISIYISISDILPLTMHYAIREMGAMLLRISELCLSFSPDPNISDGFNIVHHFFTRKYSRKWKRGQLSLEQLEKEKVKVKS